MAKPRTMLDPIFILILKAFYQGSPMVYHLFQYLFENGPKKGKMSDQNLRGVETKFPQCTCSFKKKVIYIVSTIDQLTDREFNKNMGIVTFRLHQASILEKSSKASRHLDWWCGRYQWGSRPDGKRVQKEESCKQDQDLTCCHAPLTD